MSTTLRQPAFDLEAYLAAYRPLTLPPDQWAQVRPEAEALIRAIEPTTPKMAGAHLSTLTVFLERVRGSADATMSLLTGDNIQRFRELRVQDGGAISTVTGTFGRLNRLLAARQGLPTARGRQGQARARTAPFDPYSDDEMAALERLCQALEPRDARTLRILIALAARHGCTGRLLGYSTVQDGHLLTAARRIALDPDDPLLELAQAGPLTVSGRDLARARAAAAAAGVPLRVRRLRYRWLLQVASRPGSVASLLLQHALTGDDVALLMQALGTPDLASHPE